MRLFKEVLSLSVVYVVLLPFKLVETLLYD